MELAFNSERFLSLFFVSIQRGAGYAAIAIALVLIYKSTTLVNFCQGELAMIGGFLSWMIALQWGWPLFLAIGAAMLITAAIGSGIERAFIRPFDPSDHLPLVIVTLGLFLGINALDTIIWGTDNKVLPSLFPDGYLFQFGTAQLLWTTIGTVIVVFATLGLLLLLLNKTKIGLAFRAVSSSIESSKLVGIRVGRTLNFGWALASAIGTLGAALVAPSLIVEPNMMLRVLVFAFAAAALGGLDSLGGAIAGGFGVGFAQTMVPAYVGFVPNDMGLAVAVGLIMIVLLVKPAGLFGTPPVERV